MIATIDQFGPGLANRFIRELDAAGFVIVPKEPTDEMLKVGGDNGGFDCEWMKDNTAGIYRAMIATASPTQGEGE